jgi:4-hydroxy-tetrahydrodipicolinate reductase
MNIVLLGYGRMGHEIEQVAADAGHRVILKIDKDNTGDLNGENISGADVAIEFTGPDTAPELIMKAIGLGLPVVSGSTGWQDHFREVSEFCNEHNGAFLYASNFSIGANILFHLNSELARIMSKQELYKVKIEEVHHIQKLDAPSGTAITLAKEIISQHPGYTEWILNDGASPVPGKAIPVRAVREDSVPGIHDVEWSSEIDTISLRHEAKNRRGLAAGAVMAAGFLRGKHGIFSMNDVLDF